MSLSPGTRLGVYEVASLIGEGGMGQVYRATDTTLKRQVAIKTLPASVAADAERLARFQREAEVLASLNHPHIAAIYGLQRSDGVLALVMELVEGQDLSQRIAQGAIPPAEALPMARQIADALEAAHEQGIIHRDLKPANIKVRPDGTVKVLDFGLAKAIEPGGTQSGSGPGPSSSMSPTITSPAMTQAGMILGTAAYMSPEQARGRPVDKRADIWAFGCVLYEMLTGRRPFAGDDITDTIVSIVSKELDWSALPASTPTSIRSLLRRCLEKDPKRRLRDIGEARVVLESPGETTGLSATAPVPPTRAARLPWIVTAAALLLAAALAVPALRSLSGNAPAPLEIRTDIVTPATDDPGSFALSPDGRQMVFVAAGEGGPQLWLRSLDADAARPLPGTEGATMPFWSPDSRSIGFFADAILKRLDLGIGTPQNIAMGIGSRGGSWSADNVILFSPGTSNPLFRVPAGGGPSVAVTKLDRQTSHRYPTFLPDGKHFLYFAIGVPDTTGIYLGSLDSPETTRLINDETPGTYFEPGWMLWVRSGTLVAQRLDLEKKALTGNLITVASPVAADANLGRASVSVSATGLLAYRTREGGGKRQLLWFDRSGKQVGSLGLPDEDGLCSPSLSPDGRRAAVYRVVSGNADIWILDGVRTTRLTFDPSWDRFPIWSAEGDAVLFDSNRPGHRDIYRKAANGSAPEEVLVQSGSDKLANDWSPDGRFLLFHSAAPEGRDLWVLPMQGDRTPVPFLKTRFNERWGDFSPDGHWIAYASNESGRDEIYIRPFVPPGAPSPSQAAVGQSQVSTGGGVFPRWHPTGKELYYVNPAGRMMAVPISMTSTTVTPGAPVTLFTTRIYGGGLDTQLGRQFDIDANGRFLINTVLDDVSAPITLRQNWSPEGKK